MNFNYLGISVLVGLGAGLYYLYISPGYNT